MVSTRSLGGWALILLFLQAACVTGGPRSSHAAPVEFVTLAPRSDFAPIQVSDTEFREAFAQLVLSVPLSVAPRSTRALDRRVMLASWQSGDAWDASVEGGYARLCERRGTRGDCFSFLGDGPSDTTLSDRDRFALGLILALSPAVEAAAGVLQDFSAHAMTALLTGLSLYLLVLMAPEPISKGVALAITLFLWGYLGTELWGLISATGRLWDETKTASTFRELRESSERYAQVLGPNTLRVLILLATWKAGARGKEAMTGSGLPRFPQAVQNAASAGRIRLPAAASEAEAVSVVEGRLVLTLPSGSAAVLAMQQQGGGEEGDLHHIATVENEKSTLRGGPWTQQFKGFFDKAGMSMEDPVNKVRVPGHRGPHPKEYHQEVFNRLKAATTTCRTTAQCRDALTRQLKILAEELQRQGSWLNKLVTRNQ